MNYNEIMLRFVLMLIIGLIFVIAGIFRWPFPSIMPWWRYTKYGEILNTICMLIIGFCIIMAAFDFLL